MLLAWRGNEEVFLRAASLKPSMFYRMDTRQLQRPFRWSTDFVREISPSTDAIGLLAWIVSPGPIRRAVYVPLAATFSGSGAAGDPSLLLLPSTPIKAVFTSISTTGPGLSSGRMVLNRRREPSAYYPANTAFRIIIPNIMRAGSIYKVDIAAIMANGGATVSHFYVRP